MKKIMIQGVMILFLILNFSSALGDPDASRGYLGTFKQGECMQLLGTTDAVSMNLSSITYPGNSSTVYLSAPMTKNDKTFNYTFCDTLLIGDYSYNYYDSSGNVWVGSFGIGDTEGLWITIILGVSALIILGLGLIIKNEYLGLLAGILFLVLGVYGIINGFGYVNNVYTQAIAYTSLGLGFIFFVAAVWGLIDNGG